MQLQTVIGYHYVEGIAGVEAPTSNSCIELQGLELKRASLKPKANPTPQEKKNKKRKKQQNSKCSSLS